MKEEIFIDRVLYGRANVACSCGGVLNPGSSKQEISKHLGHLMGKDDEQISVFTCGVCKETACEVFKEKEMEYISRFVELHRRKHMVTNNNGQPSPYEKRY